MGGGCTIDFLGDLNCVPVAQATWQLGNLQIQKKCLKASTIWKGQPVESIESAESFESNL